MNLIEYFISCEIFKELLECVQYLHELNPQIIHRDLKPDNILIAENAREGRFVKLCDFGLAALHNYLNPNHTGELEFIGKGLYGYVRKVRNKSTNDIYAIKMIELTEFI
ncbi:unnamed protein product [Oppiella nova]|uniref:Protein kinase domain-containing protein n=1 Tax=Oppiella nova TaxID=334625 RepID=A0A7R9QSF5_9ACAR|nr:unnamed protein product [Oppiella nova]CAG2172220.1 unnamed protein product [Oppiella nova]